MNTIHYKYSSSIVIKNKKWEILLLKKRATSKWTIPWWKQESGENNITCALRELAEETWLDNIPLELYTYTTNYTNWSHRKDSTFIWYIHDEHTPENLEPSIFEEINFFNLATLPELDKIEAFDHEIIAMLRWEKERNTNQTP